MFIHNIVGYIAPIQVNYDYCSWRLLLLLLLLCLLSIARSHIRTRLHNVCFFSSSCSH